MSGEMNFALSQSFVSSVFRRKEEWPRTFVGGRVLSVYD